MVSILSSRRRFHGVGHSVRERFCGVSVGSVFLQKSKATKERREKLVWEQDDQERVMQTFPNCSLLRCDLNFFSIIPAAQIK